MSTIDEQLDAAEEDFADAWIPKEAGEKLIGLLVRRDERTNQYGSYPILTVRDDNGDDLAWHAQRTVGRSQVEKTDPQPGDRVGIVFQGKKTGRNGPYFGYRVVVERGDAEQLDLADAEEEARNGELSQAAKAGRLLHKPLNEAA